MIWLILSLGLVLRVISLNQSLWLDEAINVLATQNFSLLGMITDYAKADFHPPLFFVILWIWSKIFGIGEVAVRIPSVIFGILTVYLIYLIGNKLYSKKLGLFAAFLLAVNPLHIYYSQEARMYALAALAVSINFFLLIKLIKGEKFKLIFLIMGNMLVLASDYVAYLIFPAQFVILIMTRQKLLITWGIALSVAILSGFWWIPTLVKQLDVGAVASANLPAWKLIVGGFDLKAIPLTFVKFIIGRISHPDKIIYASILLPIGLMFVYLLYTGIKNLKTNARNLILSWLVFPIVLASIASLVIPIYSYFRLLFVLPAFIILVATGILFLRPKLRYIFLVAVLAISLLSTSIYLLNPGYQRDDWKGLVNFLKSQNGKTIVLFESSGTLPPFDYYAKGQINARGALKDFPAKNSNDVTDLKEITINLEDIYLVEYLVEISDPQRLVERRLSELQFKRIETKDFTGLGFVHHYVK